MHDFTGGKTSVNKVCISISNCHPGNKIEKSSGLYSSLFVNIFPLAFKKNWRWGKQKSADFSWFPRRGPISQQISNHQVFENIHQQVCLSLGIFLIFELLCYLFFTNIFIIYYELLDEYFHLRIFRYKHYSLHYSGLEPWVGNIVFEYYFYDIIYNFVF